jgi:cation transport protein ChaC
MTWVFGYGSLMWHPGFPLAECRPAVLHGYHRAYMMYSTRNRGTPDCPGMVLSLAPGGECVGTAMRIAPQHEAGALEYLDQREGVGRANRRVLMPLRWQGSANGIAQPAYVYLPILSYSNYIWGVPLARQAELVARGCGKTGTSYDYLRRVLEELQKLQVREPALERLFAEAGRYLVPDAAPPASSSQPERSAPPSPR